MIECQNCHYPLDPDSKFCNKCGTRVMNNKVFCAYCGNEMAHNDKFCQKCGRPKQREGAKSYHNHPGSNRETIYPRRTSPQMEFKPREVPSQVENKQKSKSILGPILLLSIIPIILMIILAIMFLSPWKRSHPSSEHGSNQSSQSSIKKPDYDLSEQNNFEVEGRIFQNVQNRYILKWESPISIIGKEEDEKMISATDVDSAYVDEKDIEASYLTRLAREDSLKVTGKWFFRNSQLYVQPMKVLNKDGISMEEVILKEASSKKEEKDDKSSKKPEEDKKEAINGSILSERVLTESELSSMSAKELNYAKNEIYARHGRKFKSKELREYFESQSWYEPRIEPEQFNDSYLSDIEKRNAELLKEAEYRLEPNGYPLDQN